MGRIYDGLEKLDDDTKTVFSAILDFFAKDARKTFPQMSIAEIKSMLISLMEKDMIKITWDEENDKISIQVTDLGWGEILGLYE